MRKTLPALLLASALASTVGATEPPPPDRPERPERTDRRDRPDRPDRRDDTQRPPRPGAQRYSLQQAMSDRAQLHTIAFSGLAFLTGDFAADTFLPPGKVSDYFGFQSLRDTDAVQGGHSPAFLTRIAFNTLAILNPAQRAELIQAAQAQQADVRRFALLRLPLIKAFRQTLERSGPAAKAPLNRAAVRAHSAALYELDGRIATKRAEAMARVLRGLNAEQRAQLARLKFGDSRTWPDAFEPPERRSLPHDIDVALMTHASELFAWQGGGLDADTYFCPERHAMYFGGFGLKTAPALGKQDFAISTALTGDAGADFLTLLNPTQRALIEALPDLQRPQLQEIAQLRRQIATELRRFLTGEKPDAAQIQALSRRYGELDGDLAFLYAQAFAQVGQSLSPAQRSALIQLRERSPHDPRDPTGPFLYAAPLDAAGLAEAERTQGFFDGR
ncbi:Spy/CpxP family protein refolding chaperone [Inhella proteolytica]|uniref:Uncharacterized protein n=1 Tax=Inhella proteolytica TaxID=2795029 RepID=A0A931J3L0_9BURK|nr:hypothetical protein [Inhella proteolytica]MBH9575677.1 hypothetical protein [Inhella proteolytica]